MGVQFWPTTIITGEDCPIVTTQQWTYLCPDNLHTLGYEGLVSFTVECIWILEAESGKAKQEVIRFVRFIYYCKTGRNIFFESWHIPELFGDTGLPWRPSESLLNLLLLSLGQLGGISIPLMAAEDTGHASHIPCFQPAVNRALGLADNFRNSRTAQPLIGNEDGKALLVYKMGGAGLAMSLQKSTFTGTDFCFKHLLAA